MDLMHYWSQGMDSHSDLERHCNIKDDATIIHLKNLVRDICADYCIKHSSMIGDIGHAIEIDESA